MGPAIVGGALALGSTILNNAGAGIRAERDRQGNYLYNEMAAENAYVRQRQMYEDFYSPKALVKQYMEAGLSPAMMFGGTPGQGGTSAPQGNGAAGIQTPYYPINLMEALQAKVLEAQAHKTEAEAEQIEGTNERGRAEIDNLVANTKSTQLTSAYTEVQTAIASIEKTIKEATAEDIIELTKEQVQNLSKSTEKLIEEIRQLRAQNKITEESADSIIEYNKKQVLDQLANIALKYAQTAKTRSDIQLNQAQIKSLINHIAVENRDIEIKGGQLDLNEKQLKAQIKQWAWQNGIAIGGEVENMVEFWASYFKKDEKQDNGMKTLLPLIITMAGMIKK